MNNCIILLLLLCCCGKHDGCDKNCGTSNDGCGNKPGCGCVKPDRPCGCVKPDRPCGCVKPDHSCGCGDMKQDNSCGCGGMKPEPRERGFSTFPSPGSTCGCEE